jgi:hypothetical protein
MYEGPQAGGNHNKKRCSVHMENVKKKKNGTDKMEPNVPIWLMLWK